MDFKSAETYLNCSFLFHKVPMIILGENGIGKTKLIESMAKHYKKALYTTSVDYGGLKQYEMQLVGQKIKTIAISDIQRILTRKPGVRTSTLGMISSLISEGTSKDLTFNKENPMSIINGKSKEALMNFVIGATFVHLGRLVQTEQFDFLDRMIIIPVDRKKEEINFDKPFELEANPRRKINMDIYRNYKHIKFDGINPRHNVMINEIVRELKSLEIDPSIMTKSPVYIFDTETAIQMRMGIVKSIKGLISPITVTTEELAGRENDSAKA
ncbi:MAG: hypothetical protein ACREBJ_07315 [Nitrosotalea sp.]